MKTTSFILSGASVLSVLVVAALGSVGGRSGGVGPVREEEKGAGPGVAAESVVWDQTWDDKVDDVLDRNSKAAKVELSFGGGKVTGKFSGLVLGRERDAKWEGEVIERGGPAVVQLRQVEEGYVCAYELLATNAGYFGVWHDTRGGKGDVEFRKPAEGVGAR